MFARTSSWHPDEKLMALFLGKEPFLDLRDKLIDSISWVCVYTEDDWSDNIMTVLRHQAGVSGGHKKCREVVLYNSDHSHFHCKTLKLLWIEFHTNTCQLWVLKDDELKEWQCWFLEFMEHFLPMSIINYCVLTCSVSSTINLPFSYTCMCRFWSLPKWINSHGTIYTNSKWVNVVITQVFTWSLEFTI